MLVRFQFALLTVVLVTLAGSALEREALDLRRAIVAQHERTETMRERVARLRLRSQELAGPMRLARPVEEGRLGLIPPARHAPPKVVAERSRGPLLHLRQETGDTP